MLVLVTFFSIGVLAVFFLLRFLMSIESELKASRRRTPINLEVPFRRHTVVTPGTLVHSRSRLAMHRVSAAMDFQREQRTQPKSA